MKVVYLNMLFEPLHGEAIAGRDILRALEEVAEVTKVLCYDIPDAEVRVRHQLPPTQKWAFPPLPRRLFARRLLALRRWLRRYLRYRGWQRSLAARRLASDDCAVILANGGSSLPICDTVLEERCCPSALVIHHPVRRLLDGPGGKTGLEDFLRRARYVDALVFVSRIVERDWIDAGLVQGRPTYYLSNCCNEEEVARVAAQDRAALRDRLSLPQHREIALCLAAVNSSKGQDLVVAEMESLLRRRPNLHFIFVGRLFDHWGPYADSWGRDLLARVESSGLSDHFVFLGEKPNPLEYLHAADLLVLPSRREALPLVLLEAMALKTPIVASTVDGNAEAVLDGETGLLFDAEDSQGMADAIVRILDSPELGNQLAAKGFQRYWDDYSRDRQKRRLAEILAHLAASKSC